jgi:dTDP-D-glucose 4,6-dehydratase
MQKLEYDILFLGMGPIGTNLAVELNKLDRSICVISDLETKLPPIGLHKDKKIETLNWDAALQSQVYADNTYVLWKTSPIYRTKGPQIVRWLESPQFLTSRINHLSSASVYTNLEEEIFFEDSILNSSFSGFSSKQNLENFLEELCLKKLILNINYRISNVYGNNANVGFINESLLNVLNEKPIKVFKDLDVIRDYLEIQDLIWAMLELDEMNLPKGSINISTGFGESISRILELFENSLHFKPEILEVEPPALVQKRSVLSCEKLKTHIQWSPKTVEEALPTMVNSILDR